MFAALQADARRPEDPRMRALDLAYQINRVVLPPLPPRCELSDAALKVPDTRDHRSPFRHVNHGRIISGGRVRSATDPWDGSGSNRAARKLNAIGDPRWSQLRRRKLEHRLIGQHGQCPPPPSSGDIEVLSVERGSVQNQSVVVLQPLVRGRGGGAGRQGAGVRGLRQRPRAPRRARSRLPSSPTRGTAKPDRCSSVLR